MLIEFSHDVLSRIQILYFSGSHKPRPQTQGHIIWPIFRHNSLRPVESKTVYTRIYCFAAKAVLMSGTTLVYKVKVTISFSSFQPASADLADFFAVTESSKLFEYVEEDIEEEESESEPLPSRINLPIVAVLVLIISLLVAIFLQS